MCAEFKLGIGLCQVSLKLARQHIVVWHLMVLGDIIVNHNFNPGPDERILKDNSFQLILLRLYIIFQSKYMLPCVKDLGKGTISRFFAVSLLKTKQLSSVASHTEIYFKK